MLLFKKKFLEAIRTGRKTQTIRLWKRRMFRSGQRSYIPGAGYIQIESVEAVALDDLTEEDAYRDGFDSLAALRQEIDRIYPQGLENGVQAYRLIFALLSPEEQELARQRKEERKAKKQLHLAPPANSVDPKPPH